MNSQQMMADINDKIPLSQHMGLEVVQCSLNEISIRANFERNRNHKMTAFGGSVATVLTLACWSWITNYLDEQGLEGFETSIYQCQIKYNKPITDDFVGTCLGATEDLDGFRKMLDRKNKGRLQLQAFVKDHKGETVVQFSGEFVSYRVTP